MEEIRPRVYKWILLTIAVTGFLVGLSLPKNDPGRDTLGGYIGGFFVSFVVVHFCEGARDKKYLKKGK